MSDELESKNNPKNIGGDPKDAKQGEQQIPPKFIAGAPLTPKESAANPKNEEKKNRSNGFCKNLNDFAKKWKFAIELAGLIGLVVYCALNAGELWVFNSERVTMENEYNSTQTLNRQQLKAAQDQVDMMRGQLKESQSARFFDERAWIFPSKVSVENSDLGNGVVFFKVAFKNSGKTPATHVVTFIAPINAKEVYFKTDPIPQPADSDVTITPEGIGSVDSSPLGPSFIQLVTNGVPNCIFGTIKYDDVFGIHHWTQFCYLLGKDLSFTATKTHNGCDDQAD
jgi:hypothetical protein